MTSDPTCLSVSPAQVEFTMPDDTRELKLNLFLTHLTQLPDIKQEGPDILDPNARFNQILQQGVAKFTPGPYDLDLEPMVADENKPLFALDECVAVRVKGPSGVKGPCGYIKARAWRADVKSTVYVVIDSSDNVINNSAILEAEPSILMVYSRGLC